MFHNFTRHPDFKPHQPDASYTQKPANGEPVRCTFGPIPPRDGTGRFKLKPILAARIKLNAVGDPIRDKEGQPVEEMVDTRNPHEYLAWGHGHHLQMAEGATRGLSLYQIDLPAEPLCQVYARSPEDAVSVYKREMGITRFGADGPKVSMIEKEA